MHQKRVLIDVGHGFYDESEGDVLYDSGAIDLNGRQEFHLNLIAAVALQERLQTLGHHAAFVPFGLPLPDRGRLAMNYDVFVSVHHNASESKTAQGAEVCVHAVHATPADKALASMIAKSVAGALGIRDRGLAPQRLAVLSGARKTNVRAAVLVEGFFMDAPQVPLVWPRHEGVAIAQAIHKFLTAPN